MERTVVAPEQDPCDGLMIAAEIPEAPDDVAMTNYPESLYLSPEDGQQEAEEDLVKKLVRVWINERSAPEILPFQFEVIQDIMELINAQVLLSFI